MCSIMGFHRKSVEFSKVMEGFSKTSSRGPDRTMCLETGPWFLCFHRLSIMGLHEEGMQPFALPNGTSVVCNGEIYNFRGLKEKELAGASFVSDSDCEVLLPLYQKFGTEMFGMLDAEFALILYDAEVDSLIAARDPIGIRPLYYGYAEDGSIVLASEPANLTGICGEIHPFPPGHYYKDGAFVCYRDITMVPRMEEKNLDVICQGIRERLIEAVEKRLDADVPVGFLLSGGLDSSLVCAIAARLLKKPIPTFSIGMEKDAIDLKYAKQVADHIGSHHKEIIMTTEEVLESLEEVIRILGTFDITTIRASIGMYLICKGIRETADVKVLLTGEISDELFGYKYTDFAPDPEAFQQESVKRVKELHAYDVLRADRCISVHSMEARVPFGDLDFASYVLSIDPALKMNSHGHGKYLLRRAFEGDWLPLPLLYREKAAFSDAVGHSMVDDLKALAERSYTDQEYEEKRLRYSHGRPFTKESLMYREIFEKYYPGQGVMIPGFWMPNQEWEGCRVSDPSARVLSNYGASGI